MGKCLHEHIRAQLNEQYSHA